MDNVTRATTVLRTTEAELRRILSEAAQRGEYTSVVRIAAWARSLSTMLNGDTMLNDTTESRGHPQASPKERKPRQSVTARIAGDDEYPRFLRRGNRLVRVSWSKRDKSEYEHRAPYAVLKGLAGAITSKGSEGRVFSTDELLPVYTEDNRPAPHYQIYACLGLLKHAGLVEQHGRQGYSIPRSEEFVAAVESIWRSLPEK